MKIARMRWGVCFVLLGMASGAFAQSELPAGFVFKNQMPEYSAWTVLVVHPDKNNPQARQDAYAAAMRKMAEENPGVAKFLSSNPTAGTLKPAVDKILVTKTGKTRSENIVYAGGKTEQRWWLPGAYLRKDPFSGRVFFESGVEDEALPAFPELTWIAAGNFQGVEKNGGRELWVFESKQQKLSLEDPKAYRDARGSDDPEGIVTVKAQIDPKTQMPVIVEWDGQTRTYQLSPAPAVALKLPEDLAQIVEKSARRAADATRPMSPP